MKILLTGATGFVGANLLRELLHQGEPVRVLLRPGSDPRNLDGLEGIERAIGDLTQRETLARALTGIQLLYHVAASYTFWARDPESIYAANLLGTRNILEEAFRQGVERVVYTSTVGAIGLWPDGRPADENTPLHPESLTRPYKHSKHLAELEALRMAQRGLPVVIVNPSTPIGPYDIKPTPTGKILVDFLNRKMPAYLDTGLNLVHVRDVAQGHILAAQKGRVGERYILGHQDMTLQEILEELSQITGIPAPTIRIPYRVAWIAGYLNQFLSDHLTHRPPQVPLEGVRMARKKMFFSPAKAIRELGLPQTPIRKALEEAIQWFQAEGYVKRRTP
ncbi:MAG: NAD-dependent epimerase/dehydratase family protein [Candidatus Tectomicrobia bacterium]|uniref:NAD-dependent epimerase/dehydratase family protein n=1 Tax=Tectimicrobiota bacterium TaxID=2528274 RepID=A0A932CNG3_UNCTE|nr:NAD-dependent epimerase/dehydratase family protein [Candidatus Tectomicrobia bacterium]